MPQHGGKGHGSDPSRQVPPFEAVSFMDQFERNYGKDPVGERITSPRGPVYLVPAAFWTEPKMDCGRGEA